MSTEVSSPLQLVPSGYSILANPNPVVERLLARQPGSTFSFSLEAIADEQSTLQVNLPACSSGEQPTTYRIPTHLFFVLSAVDSSDGSNNDAPQTSTTNQPTQAKASSNVRAAYITAYARRIDSKYACKSCKKAKMHCYRASPDDTSIQSIKCAGCVNAHRVCEVDRNAFETMLAPGTSLKFSKQTTLTNLLKSDPIQINSPPTTISSYEHLLDHISTPEAPYYMYLPINETRPSKQTLSWLEDVFSQCGTKIDGSELAYEVKLGSRANINPCTAPKYAQHVPLPYKPKQKSPPPPPSSPPPAPTRSSLAQVNAQAGPSSDQIITQSLPGLKRKFGLGNHNSSGYPVSKYIRTGLYNTNTLISSPGGRYDDAEVSERFGDADSTRREEEYEYQTDHSSDDEEGETVNSPTKANGHPQRSDRATTPKATQPPARTIRTMSPDSPGIGRSRMHSLDDTPKALRHNDFDNLTLPDTDLSGFVEANFNANLRDDIQTAIAYHRRRISQVVCQGYDARDRTSAQDWLDNSLQEFKKLITQDMPSDPEERTRLLLDDGLAFLMKTLNGQPIFARQCNNPLTAPLKHRQNQ